MVKSSSRRSGRPVTLAHVAQLAQVSVATASKALNGKGEVSARTRAKVLSAAKELSFTPNAQARSLIAGRTGTVGLLTSDLDGRFSIPILLGAEDAFGAGEISVFLCDARGDAIREQYHLKALLSRRVDGLIVVGARPDPRPSLGLNLPVPVVYSYAPSENPADISIVSDNISAGYAATKHLIDQGRTRIAHITGDPTYLAAQDRAQGAKRALADAQLPLIGARTFFGTWSEEWGRSATRQLLTDYPDVDGIFCGSDQIARGVLDMLRDIGRDVPNDVAVIGFDNWQVLALQARPPLSSVDMNLEQLGRLAAQNLFAAISGQAQPGIQTVQCRVIPRASSLN